MGMLAGTRSGLVDVPGGGVVAFAGHDVRAIDGDWVVLDGREVRRRGDADGDGPVVPVEDALTCVTERLDGTALAGTTGAHLYRIVAGPERIVSFDRAAGRDAWYTPWGDPPDVRSMAVAADGTVLVNVHVGGIVRSADGGGSWLPTIDIHADVHQVIAFGGGRAVAACAVGLAHSADNGATWSLHDHGLHATYARSVAVAGATVLLAVSEGPGGDLSAVYRRPLEGDGPFQRCSSGLPVNLGGNIDTFWLAGTPDGRVAFTTPTGDAYASADEGATWSRVATGLPPVRCLLLT